MAKSATDPSLSLLPAGSQWEGGDLPGGYTVTSPALFDLCEPRPGVTAGASRESDFAADLAQVLRGHAPPDYADPVRFFASTHPTRGSRTLLQQVFS